MNRDSIIKGLAVLSSIILVLFIGYSIVWIIVNSSKKELRAEGTETATLDVNAELKGTIDSLEVTWQTIQSHRFSVGQDPLHLGRVVKDFAYAQAGRTESDEGDQLRLTATVIDDNPKAIIKYNGRSHVVTQGGWLENAYRVVSISEKQAILEGGAGRVVLYSKPVSETEESLGGDSDYSEGESGLENY